VSYYKKLPYMELIYAPRKRRVAVQLYLKILRSQEPALAVPDLQDSDLHIANSIKVYNRGRELMQQLYELRKRIGRR